MRKVLITKSHDNDVSMFVQCSIVSIIGRLRDIKH